MRIRLAHVAAIVTLLVVLVAGARVHQSVTPENAPKTDIYYNYVEGGRLLRGENPYARIQGSDMLKNQKYATYFPLFYYLSAGTQWAGLREYLPWISFWRLVFLIFTLAAAAMVFLTLYSRRWLAAAVFATAFWLFSRWNLYITQQGLLDPIPMFLLLLSLYLFDRRPWASLLVLSLSLAFKQMAIFLVPLYLIWFWQATPAPQRLRRSLLAAAAIASAPLVAALPFLAWDARSFLLSIVFSATRESTGHISAATVGTWLGYDGLQARIPMFALIGFTYVLAWRRQIGKYTATLFAMAAFIDFSPVLFLQYFTWLVPFILLAAADLQPAAAWAAAPGEAPARAARPALSIRFGRNRRRAGDPAPANANAAAADHAALALPADAAASPPNQAQ